MRNKIIKKLLKWVKNLFSTTSKKKKDDDWPIEIKWPEKPDYEMIEYMKQRKLMARQFDYMLKNHYFDDEYLRQLYP